MSDKVKMFLAPMAGFSDRAFRTLCVRHHADLTYTEMVSAKGLEYQNERTWSYIDSAPEEKQYAVQLFGNEPEIMANAAQAVSERVGDKLVYIDVNMGCPVRKVFGKGEGAALLANPKLAAAIVYAMAQVTNIPISAKFRTGVGSDSLDTVKFAQLLESAGASALAVHGRSARQFYSGKADWESIARIKTAVNIPVFGSGDIFSMEDAQHMTKECGVDAVMVARGARGNPWIFEGRTPNIEERFNTMVDHVNLYVDFEGESHLTALRSQLTWYVHGLNNATDFRASLTHCESKKDFLELIARSAEKAVL